MARYGKTTTAIAELAAPIDGSHRPFFTPAVAPSARRGRVRRLAESIGSRVTSYQGKGTPAFPPAAARPTSSEEAVETAAARPPGDRVRRQAVGVGHRQWRLPLPIGRGGCSMSSAPSQYPAPPLCTATPQPWPSPFPSGPRRRLPRGRRGRHPGAVDAGARRRASSRGFVDAFGRPPAPGARGGRMTKAGFWIMKHLPVADGRGTPSPLMAQGTALPMAVGMASDRASGTGRGVDGARR